MVWKSKVVIEPDGKYWSTPFPIYQTKISLMITSKKDSQELNFWKNKKKYIYIYIYISNVTSTLTLWTFQTNVKREAIYLVDKVNTHIGTTKITWPCLCKWTQNMKGLLSSSNQQVTLKHLGVRTPCKDFLATSFDTITKNGD